MSRRCTATNRQGKPCRRYAVPGTWVCHMHGGAAPQVVAAAQRRLLAAADPAAATLVDLLDAHDQGIRLRASREILDRAGLAPHARVDLADAGALMPVEQLAEGLDLLVERAERELAAST